MLREGRVGAENHCTLEQAVCCRMRLYLSQPFKNSHRVPSIDQAVQSNTKSYGGEGIGEETLNLFKDDG